MEQERICRRCLTREMAGQEEVFASLRDYIENLDIAVKAGDGLYESRLLICKECDMLLEGMCRVCGCYVELRAAVARHACPHKKW